MTKAKPVAKKTIAKKKPTERKQAAKKTIATKAVVKKAAGKKKLGTRKSTTQKADKRAPKAQAIAPDSPKTPKRKKSEAGKSSAKLPAAKKSRVMIIKDNGTTYYVKIPAGKVSTVKKSLEEKLAPKVTLSLGFELDGKLKTIELPRDKTIGKLLAQAPEGPKGPPKSRSTVYVDFKSLQKISARAPKGPKGLK